MAHPSTGGVFPGYDFGARVSGRVQSQEITPPWVVRQAPVVVKRSCSSDSRCVAVACAPSWARASGCGAAPPREAGQSSSSCRAYLRVGLHHEVPVPTRRRLWEPHLGHRRSRTGKCGTSDCRGCEWAMLNNYINRGIIASTLRNALAARPCSPRVCAHFC